MLVDKTQKENCCNLLAPLSKQQDNMKVQEKRINGNTGVHLEQKRKDAERARLMLLGIKLQLSQRPQ